MNKILEISIGTSIGLLFTIVLIWIIVYIIRLAGNDRYFTQEIEKARKKLHEKIKKVV